MRADSRMANTSTRVPGLLSWQDVERYQSLDPQNGRLRWLIDDLEDRRAFELLWVPPSMHYYDTGSVYEITRSSRLHQAPDLLRLAGGTEGRLVAGQLRIRAPRLCEPRTTVTRSITDGVVASGSRSAPSERTAAESPWRARPQAPVAPPR